MKSVKLIAQKLFGNKIVLALALLLIAPALRAATITMECKVNGYSTAGWILIVPGSKTGGRVQYDARLGRFYTDRVQRKEPLRITYAANFRNEFCHGGNWGGLYTFSGGYKEAGSFGKVRLPYSVTLTTPNDPSWDNVRADISTSAGYFSHRVPIGKR